MKLQNKAIRFTLLTAFTLNGLMGLLLVVCIAYLKQTQRDSLSILLSLKNVIYFLSFFPFCIAGWIFIKHFNPLESEKNILNDRIIDSPLEPKDQTTPSRKWKKVTGIFIIFLSFYLGIFTDLDIHSPKLIGNNTQTWLYLFCLLLIFFYGFTIICLWLNLAKTEKKEEEIKETEEVPEDAEITFKWK